MWLGRRQRLRGTQTCCFYVSCKSGSQKYPQSPLGSIDDHWLVFAHKAACCFVLLKVDPHLLFRVWNYVLSVILFAFCIWILGPEHVVQRADESPVHHIYILSERGEKRTDLHRRRAIWTLPGAERSHPFCQTMQ